MTERVMTALGLGVIAGALRALPSPAASLMSEIAPVSLLTLLPDGLLWCIAHSDGHGMTARPCVLSGVVTCFQ